MLWFFVTLVAIGVFLIKTHCQDKAMFAQWSNNGVNERYHLVKANSLACTTQFDLHEKSSLVGYRVKTK